MERDSPDSRPAVRKRSPALSPPALWGRWLSDPLQEVESLAVDSELLELSKMTNRLLRHVCPRFATVDGESRKGRSEWVCRTLELWTVPFTWPHHGSAALALW